MAILRSGHNAGKTNSHTKSFKELLHRIGQPTRLARPGYADSTKLRTSFTWGRWTKYVDCFIHGPHLSCAKSIPRATQHSEDRDGRVRAALNRGEDAEILVPEQLRPERDARASIIMCIRLIWNIPCWNHGNQPSLVHRVCHRHILIDNSSYTLECALNALSRTHLLVCYSYVPAFWHTFILSQYVAKSSISYIVLCLDENMRTKRRWHILSSLGQSSLPGFSPC